MSVNSNGNVAALCEALELCKHELCEMCRRHNPGEMCVNGCETIIRAKTALAANHPPKPDPNWKDICAKCMDGDEPKFCEYYGEPNGCNSPIYGEHPTAEASSVVGNAAAMYSCLLKILAEMIDLGGMAVGRKACFSPDAIADEIRQALAVPPRNCDVGTAEEQRRRFEIFCNNHSCHGCPLEHANGCRWHWAQMPYEAANESEAK